MKIADITEGTPANIVYPHDSRAAVVIRRTPKRVIVARVETHPVEIESGNVGDTPPITVERGILDRPISGTERSYTLKEDSRGNAYGQSKLGRISFGSSVSRTNYQNF